MKPTSDSSFSDSLDEFICKNATEIVSANYWTLCEIKSLVDPEAWEEDPDSFITIGLDKDLQNNEDPFDLILEIHVTDEDAIKEKVKNLGLYTAPNSFNKCLNVALIFKDGESVWDVLKRNVFDWNDILRYSIYLENEEDQIDIMPTCNFYADWLDDYLGKES